MGGDMTESSVGEIRVIHVDDEPDFAALAADFLEREATQLCVETETSADAALDRLATEHFDCVVSDYQMPGTDGLAFLETLREDRSSEIPFIIFTGKGREEVAIEALNLGADRYLQKGGDPGAQFRVLAQAIDQEVEHHRTQRDLERRLISTGTSSTSPAWASSSSIRRPGSWWTPIPLHVS